APPSANNPPNEFGTAPEATVSVAVDAEEPLITVPVAVAPFNPPTAMLKPFNANVPVVIFVKVTVLGDAELSAPTLPTRKMPPSIVTPPVNELFPLSTQASAPEATNSATVVAAPLPIAPLIVLVPLPLPDRVNTVAPAVPPAMPPAKFNALAESLANVHRSVAPSK